MEEDRRRDGGGEVYRPADQEEGGSNSDAAPPTSGGLPIGSSPLVLPRSALGRIVQRRHGGRQRGVRIKPCRQWEPGWERHDCCSRAVKNLRSNDQGSEQPVRPEPPRQRTCATMSE